MTFPLCDPGWSVRKSDVQNKWDDNTHTQTHRSEENPNRGRSGQFMGCPSCGREPSRERDRNSFSRSGSRRRGGGEGRGGRGAGGRGGGVGAGVLDSENNGRIR